MRPPSFNVGMTLAELEKQAILYTVQYFQGNATAAAKSLGLSDKTVREKMVIFKKEEDDARAARADQRHADKATLARMRGIPLGVNPDPHNGASRSNPGPNLEKRMEDVASLSAKNGTGSHRTDKGAPMESITNASAKQSVSVPKREEVQGVLPKQASGNRNR